MTDAPLLLLVEDDAAVMLVLEDALVEAGFSVLTASDGDSAICELEKEPNRFKGLITDIRLGPGPDGWAVAKRGRELSPNLPIIYLSGDSIREWTANGVPNSVSLEKPVAMAQVVVAVSQLLNAAGPGAL
jgi:DNA-binding response OmpR family regulator